MVSEDCDDQKRNENRKKIEQGIEQIDEKINAIQAELEKLRENS